MEEDVKQRGKVMADFALGKYDVLVCTTIIESIFTEDGHVVLRRFKGLHFDRLKLAPFAKDGVKV